MYGEERGGGDEGRRGGGDDHLMSSPTVSSRQTLTLRELWMAGILAVRMTVCILPTDSCKYQTPEATNGT